MSVAETIRAKLAAAFQPEQLEIVDQSDLHRGHAGARPEGETHFKVSIVSSRFEGMNRVARHRAVTAALASEMDNPIHALALSTLTPAELARR